MELSCPSWFLSLAEQLSHDIFMVLTRFMNQMRRHNAQLTFVGGPEERKDVDGKIKQLLEIRFHFPGTANHHQT
ncbi:MAG: hypothetical protein Q8P02_03130, partial [Candidatus Micrarchaeota archaeon]|nr:hypothetical protein [Candidatus Micrarchaeota archaeon]